MRNTVMIAITQLVKLQLLEQNAILKIKFQLRLWRKSHNSKKYSCNFRKVTIVRYKVKIKTRLQWREIKLQLWKSCNCYSHNLISHNCDFFHDCNIIMKIKWPLWDTNSQLRDWESIVTYFSFHKQTQFLLQTLHVNLKAGF